MAWDDITNPEVAAGAPISTALVTALRDNPIAIAEGATGSPAIRAKANAIEAIYTGEGDRTGEGQVTFFSKLDFADIGLLRYDVMASFRASTAGSAVNCQIEVRVSANGGSTWSSWTSLTPDWRLANNGDASVAVAHGYVNMRDGAITGASTSPTTTLTGARIINDTSFAANLNAIQFRLDVNGSTSVASGSALLYPVAGPKA